MQAITAKRQGEERDIASSERVLRALFVLVVALGGTIFWLAPHPPMVDLPQHAAQVATLHDVLLGASPWASLLRINLFTPYLTGYGLALALSFVMPVTVAIKVLLTLVYYGFVSACIQLRKQFAGDARIDWLFVPSFFGFAYDFGLFTFLVAAPLALLFVLLARQYAELPSIRRGIVLVIADVALFFSHGLLFLFASAIGVAFIVFRRRTLARTSLLLMPYALPGMLCAIYVLVQAHANFSSSYLPIGVRWLWGARWFLFFSAPWGFSANALVFMPAGMLMMVAPWLMGLRIRREPASLAPFALTVAVWLCVPSYAANTGLLCERFALFILPFYALMFASADCANATRSDSARRAVLYQTVLALACVLFLGSKANRTLEFAAVSADFDRIMATVEPAQRALAINADSGSPASGVPNQYDHHALWYQAEHRGFVDFNFAWYPPQILRYRLDQLPAVGPSDIVEQRMFYETFNWERSRARAYRYFFVRHTAPIRPDLFKNGECQVALLATAGNWSVFENRTCR